MRSDSRPWLVTLRHQLGGTEVSLLRLLTVFDGEKASLEKASLEKASLEKASLEKASLAGG